MSNAEKKLDNEQQATQSSFLAVQVITGQCHAILNTQFTPPDKKPDWFDDLNTKLDNAKRVAKEWVDEIAPEVSASIPAQVINYSTTFYASVDAIKELCEQHPSAKGSDDPIVKQVIEIVQDLITEVDKRKAVVKTMQGKLTTWGDKMQKAHDDLSSGANNIQKATIDLHVDIEKMNNAITNNENAIKKLNHNLIYAQIAVGVGIFVFVSGIALTVATAGTGAVVSGIVAAGGVTAIVGGAVTWGIIQGQINDDYDKIANDQKEKDADNQQIIALQGLSLASSLAVNAIEIATSTLSDFETTWKIYGDHLQSVINELRSNNPISKIAKEKITSNIARRRWDNAVELAKELSGTKVTIETKNISPIAQAA